MSEQNKARARKILAKAWPEDDLQCEGDCHPDEVDCDCRICGFYNKITIAIAAALDEAESVAQMYWGQRYKQATERIAGYCGHPDAAEGCRLILKLLKEKK